MATGFVFLGDKNLSCINHEIKSIFIHVGKCGGTSLSSFSWNKGNGHSTYADYQNSIKDIDEYFTWSFVRNPWERAASVYKACQEQYDFMSFEEYINILYKHRSLLNTKKYVSYGGGNILIPEIPVTRIHHWPSNLSLTDTNGELKVKFIGTIENIENDFKIVCENLKQEFNIPPHFLSMETLSHKKQRERKTGKSKIKTYKNRYNDSLINQVGEIYKKDIELFNYQY